MEDIVPGKGISVKEIGNFLNCELINYQKNFLILEVRPPDNIVNNCLTILTRPEEFDLWFNKETSSRVLAVIPKELEKKARETTQVFVLVADNPRLTFIRVMSQFFKERKPVGISITAIIDSTVIIGENAYIGDYATIKGDVVIGKNSYIMDKVSISGNVQIGDNVVIKSDAVIGEKGFNYVYDESGNMLEFPHIGRVIINDNVDIGSNTTIMRGTLSETIIGNSVKIDDNCLIAHNVQIGDKTLIAGNVGIAGSVKIGTSVKLGLI